MQTVVEIAVNVVLAEQIDPSLGKAFYRFTMPTSLVNFLAGPYGRVHPPSP